jgi:hypothetical protein
LIIVFNWQDSELIDKSVKSCDNKEIGDVRELNQTYLIINKGGALIRVPRGSIGTFNDGKVYLRATEAEVLSGVYPFLDSENADWQTTTQSNVKNTSPVVPQTT